MRAAIGFVLLAVLAVAGAWWLAGLPGSFTATISGTTLTTSTPVALLLLGVLFILIYAVLRLLAAPRRCCRATAGGSPVISPTFGALTCCSRRRAYGATDSK